ncbi:E3 ubiquitin-protein ligase TRIM35 isoform X2 [Salmo salar]|uniref:E3 ubiquitin-protein ligase TRIM35 isoform X2 n=1 Tax=Salmo salar TaxID=8030 RepID=A0ABM3EJX0_SALSA|nr:E3 ubiquitin-protein ligase TRIM35 isoform X2 [Salmo salar]
MKAYPQRRQHRVARIRPWRQRQIKDLFVELHQFLYDEEAARLAALKEEEEETIGVMKSMVTKAAAGMLYLKETITVITQEMTDAEDMTLLQNFKVTIERAQCTGQGPERISGVLIDVAKHLCNLKYRVWKKMLLHVEYTPVTLDPNTAHPCLLLSHDLTSLEYTSQPHRLPDNPERFHMVAEVLCMTGLSSGSHCWVVDIGCKQLDSGRGLYVCHQECGGPGQAREQVLDHVSARQGVQSDDLTPNSRDSHRETQEGQSAAGLGQGPSVFL